MREGDWTQYARVLLNVKRISLCELNMNRREMLRTMGAGFGAVGIAGVLGASESSVDRNPLAPKPPHFPAKAKRVIYLFLNGGPSQVDTFDPKPMLTKYNGQPMPAGNLKTERKTGNLLKSPFEFKQLWPERTGSERDLPETGRAARTICA